MITKKQKQILEYIKESQQKNNYAPSLEEIRKHFKLASVSTAHYYIKKLQEEGYLKKERNQPRALEVNFLSMDHLPNKLSEPESILIPLLGSANCGPAVIFAEQNVEGYLKIDKELTGSKNSIFAIRAVGNSLNRAQIGTPHTNIEDGDFVLIDYSEKEPYDGDYVLSIINDMANLKRYRINNQQITLISESDEVVKPIFIHQNDRYSISGKIINVVKNQ